MRRCPLSQKKSNDIQDAHALDKILEQLGSKFGGNSTSKLNHKGPYCTASRQAPPRNDAKPPAQHKYAMPILHNIWHAPDRGGQNASPITGIIFAWDTCRHATLGVLKQSRPLGPSSS
eukprot:809444-Pelagomonas_calceolata.AAC.1